MADLSDVETAFVALVAGAFYPSGTAAPSVIGAPVRVYAGWPIPAALDADLAAGTVNVSVFPPPNMERNTTRFLSEWRPASPPVQTMTASVVGNTVTVGGTIAVPQYVSVIADEAAYSLAVQSSDTLASVSSGLAALIAADRPASSAGAVLTVPGTHRLIARVGVPAPLLCEVERSERAVVTTVWAPSPDLRASAGRIVRAALARQAFLSLVDGTAAALRYSRTDESDTNEKVRIYRRDVSYWAEYGQFLVEDGFQITVPQSGTTSTHTDASTGLPIIRIS